MKINPFIFFELIGKPVNNCLIEIITAKMGIAIGRLNFENAIT